MAQPSRRYTDIVRMLAESTLDSAVQESALEVFRRLGEVEARLHDEPLETIHFHAVGAVDSIVDVVGAVIGLQALGVDLVVFGRNTPSPYTVNGRPLYVHLNGLAIVLLK